MDLEFCNWLDNTEDIGQMMSDYIPVPVPAAEQISRKYEKDQVIVISADRAHDKLHFTSYGKTATDKLEAARACILIKKYYFEIEVEDGTEAPIGFDNFEWSNEVNDFVEIGD